MIPKYNRQEFGFAVVATFIVLVALAFPQQSHATTIVSSGLLGQYPMTNCDGTQSTSTASLVDCGGNSYNGTLVNSPTFSSKGIVLNGSNQYVSLPTILASSTVTVQIFADTASQAALVNYQELMGQQSGGHFEVMASGDKVNTSPAIFLPSNGGFVTVAAQSASSPSFITAILGSSTDSLYINGTEVSGYVVRAGSLPYQRGQFDLGSRAGTLSFQGTMYYALFYSRALTPSEVAQNYIAVSGILTARGVNLAPTSISTTNSAVFLGDSITAGMGVPASYVGLTSAPANFAKYNVGVGGETLNTITQNAFGTLSSLFHPLAQKNIATIFAGTNDICGSYTPQQTYNSLASLGPQLKAIGWNVELITTLDRNGCSSNISTYNTLIRTGWSSFADALIDVAANPLLGTAGASSNTTYFQSDKIHPTTAGQQLIANQVSIALNALTNPLTSLSSVATSSVTNSAATISWLSNASSSSLVDFGPSSSYGTSTGETDTATRVLSHSSTISGLLGCTIYHYHAHSRQLDPNGEVLLAGNDATSSDQTFLTTGCTGSAAVSTSTDTTITTGAGGTMSFGTTTLTVPPSYSGTTTSATFQAKQLDPTAFFTAASAPTGRSKIGNYVVDLKALIDATTTLPTFSTQITITLSYSPSDISGINLSSLTIYRYDSGTAWTALTGCTVNTSADTVTCQTSNFSDFSLFGTAQTQTSTSLLPDTGGGYGIPIQVLSTSTVCPAGAIYNTETGTPCSAIPSPSPFSFTFTRNLNPGTSNSQVKSLQKYLNQRGFTVSTTGPGSAGDETEYFGPATKAALIKFQKANGIKPPVGYFGPITRAYINSHR